MLSLRKKILEWIITMATNHRGIIYISTLVITIAMLAASANLKVDMRWTEMLPESIPSVKEFKTIDKNFIQPGNMIIAITGKDPVQLETITDEAEKLLKKNLIADPAMSLEEIKKSGRLARQVYGKIPEEWLTKNMMRLAKPKDIKRMKEIYRDPTLLNFLKHLNNDFEKEYADSENVKNQERQIVQSLDGTERFISNLLKAAGTGVSKREITDTVRDMTIGRPYSFSLDNTMSLIMIASAIPTDDAEAMVQLDYRIEDILAPVVKKYPDYKIERTGMTAIARDEMDSIGPYTIAITFAAFVIIFLLLWWNFRSAMTPFLTLTPIVIGIIWSMGLIAITIGTLNMITSMMMVVLLGLGIDFTIHLASRFQEEIGKGTSLEDALRLTIGSTGKGVSTGAITTAVAFMALLTADTKAIWEFGFCAGTGVLLTLAATLWLLPSMLASRAVKIKEKQKEIKEARDFSWIATIAETTGRHFRVVITAAVLVTIAGIIGGRYLQWEYNFMNLEPANLRSVELQDEIVDKFKFSATPSMVTAKSVQESRDLRKKFKDKRIVGDVNDISLWVSRPDLNEGIPHIKELNHSVTQKIIPPRFNSAQNRSTLYTQIDRLWANMVEIQALSFTGGQDRVVEKTSRLVGRRGKREAGILTQLRDSLKAEKQISWKSITDFSDTFSHQLQYQTIAMSRGTEAVTVAMIPEDIRNQYVSTKTKDYLMHIMPKKNLFEQHDLLLFNEVVSTVKHGVTGMPQLMLEMNTSTVEEGRIAMLLAIVIIMLVLLLDFRNPLKAAITILPLASGIALTLGTMWLIGMKLNFVNMIALPVIIGIGVDDGVHFMHRYLDEGHSKIREAVTSVGHAMLMTSLTTMIGFGSLMFYLMRGVQSMGFVLFIGVGWCFIVTVTVLPALMVVFKDRLAAKTENSNE